MSTIYTHAVVGLGLARVYASRPMPWSYWGLAALLPVVPDVDVFSEALTAPPWAIEDSHTPFCSRCG